MKAFIQLFDFRYIVGRQQLWLYLYMLIYLVYAVTSNLVDPLLGLSILIFTIAPLKPAFLMFIFYLLWEYVTTFSFGVTGVMIMQVLMVAKIIAQKEKIKRPKGRIERKSMFLQVGLLIYMVIMGIVSYLMTGSLTGVGFIFKVLITFYAITYLYSDRAYNDLIRAILQVLMLSALISTIYGFYHDTAVDRWISGLGRVSQLYGTLGTTRMALFYLTSLAYFLYYVGNVVMRVGGIILFTVLTLMTVSLSAFGLYFIIIGIYLLSIGSFKKAIVGGCVVILAAALTFPLWSKIGVIQPILYRIEFSANAYNAGDVNAMTTGRANIQDAYMDNLEESNPFTVIFGNARSAMSTAGVEMNSHNSYIDILFYFGAIGLLLLLLYQGKKILLLRGQPYFYPILTLKAIFLIGGSTVSVMTASYFMVLIFI